MELYIGLMSGTSMDGIDAALVDVDTHHLVAGITVPYPEKTKQLLINSLVSQLVEIKSLAALNQALGQAFGAAALAVLEKAQCSAKEVRAIGSHGQTICHDPFAETPFTLQLGCAHQIAEITHLPVITDFRSRDMVLGGQGAPFAPLYHQMLFAEDQPLAVVNIGGIANITLLSNQNPPLGYDVGPGNVLLDAWCLQHCGTAYDASGHFALQGKIIEPLLQQWLKDTFFHQLPPKSIGKEYFLGDFWTAQSLSQYPPADVQATLVALTAQLISNAIKESRLSSNTLLVCGGGVHNIALMNALTELLPCCVVQSTLSKGVSPDFLEAMMFAWFAAQYLQNKPVDLTSITGSRHPARCGVYYPA